MDEPFTALDVLTAETLRTDFLDLWIEHQLTTKAVLMATHNIEEAPAETGSNILGSNASGATLRSMAAAFVPWRRQVQRRQFLSGGEAARCCNSSARNKPDICFASRDHVPAPLVPALRVSVYPAIRAADTRPGAIPLGPSCSAGHKTVHCQHHADKRRKRSAINRAERAHRPEEFRLSPKLQPF
jgi:hypothetical protein